MCRCVAVLNVIKKIVIINISLQLIFPLTYIANRLYLLVMGLALFKD